MVIGQFVKREARVVMPESLWKCSVFLAHEGYQDLV